MKKLFIPIIGIVIAVGIFAFIPKETHQEPTPIATTEAPTTAIPETTEETTTVPETTIVPTTEAVPETENALLLNYISLLDGTIYLYEQGDLDYGTAREHIVTDCYNFGITNDIKDEYLAKLDSITPQVKETQAPVVQKPVEQKPTVQEPVVQEPVVQQPQQTGEVYKGESIDIYINMGYTKEEAKQLIDEYLAPEVLDTIKGVTTEDDVKGWGQ